MCVIYVKDMYNLKTKYVYILKRFFAYPKNNQQNTLIWKTSCSWTCGGVILSLIKRNSEAENSFQI